MIAAQVLQINMINKTETVSGGFKIKTFKPIQKAKAFTIDYIALSNTFYQINAFCNVLVINFSSVDHTITITPGNYSSTDLITAIQTQLTAIDAGFSISLGPYTQLTTIAHTTTNFQIKLASSTMNKILGFGTTNLTGANTYTGTDYFNNSWPFITMHSDALSLALKSVTGDNRISFVETILLDAPSGDYVFYRPYSTKYYPMDITGSTDVFDFYFVDPYKNRITDFSNGQCMLQISFY